MKLLFLGSGSAFTVGDNNYQSNMLLTSESGQTLLLDCGNDIRHSLHDQGLTATDIGAVYVSHLHADHVGGLEWLAFTNKFSHPRRKPKLFISDSMVGPLWDNVLSAGLSTLKGEKAQLASFFEVNVINTHSHFEWENTRFSQFKTFHAINNDEYIPSFGLMMARDERKVLITMDSEFRKDLFMPYYESATIIFQDCETLAHPSTVHAHYQDIKNLPSHIKKKMWLYDYNPGPRPDPIPDGFCGYVLKGQDFDLWN